MIGVQPSQSLVLAIRRDLPPSMKHPVWLESAAKAASAAFELGDRIIATTDPDNPEQIKDLPLDPRKPKSNRRDYFEFSRRMQLLAGKSVVIRVERGTKEKNNS